MATLSEMMTNRTQYPDEREVDFFGSKVTMKDLRDGLMPKSDMTSMTQKWSDERRQLEESTRGFQAALVQTQEELSQAIAAKRAAGEIKPDEIFNYEGDPILGPLVKDLKAATKRLEAQEQDLKATKDRVQQHEIIYTQGQYLTRIHALKANDASLDPKALIDFAVAKQIPDIDLAYRLMTEETRTAAAVEKAQKEGYEKGKQEVVFPTIPSGRRPSTLPPPEGVTNFEQARDRAAEDPEILRLLQGAE